MGLERGEGKILTKSSRFYLMWAKVQKILTGGCPMKICKIWLGGFLVVALLGCFTVSTAQAQFPDLSGWVGKWFKLNVKTTGVFFNGSKMQNENQNIVAYLSIKNFNSPSEFKIKLWQQNKEGGWEVFVDDLSVKIIAGTDLDFLCVTTLEINDNPSNPQFFGFAARITGRLTKGELKSATFKSLGGFSWEQLLDLNPEFFASGVSINGSFIDPSKLPFTP
jgi:hypothetical protein